MPFFILEWILHKATKSDLLEMKELVQQELNYYADTST